MGGVLIVSLGERVVATVDGTKFNVNTNRLCPNMQYRTAPASDRTGAVRALSQKVRRFAMWSESYINIHIYAASRIGGEHGGYT